MLQLAVPPAHLLNRSLNSFVAAIDVMVRAICRNGKHHMGSKVSELRSEKVPDSLGGRVSTIAIPST